jgi:hypothetical protein
MFTRKKCRYEMREQKEVSVWYAGPFADPSGRAV